MALEKTSHAVVSIDLGSCAESATPGTCHAIKSRTNSQGNNSSNLHIFETLGWTLGIVFSLYQVVPRRSWPSMQLSISKKEQLYGIKHTTHPATPPARPERMSLFSSRFLVGSCSATASELIRMVNDTVSCSYDGSSKLQNERRFPLREDGRKA